MMAFKGRLTQCWTIDSEQNGHEKSDVSFVKRTRIVYPSNDSGY